MKKMTDSEQLEYYRSEMLREREAEKVAEVSMPKWMTRMMLISLAGGMLGAVIASVFGGNMLAAAFAVQIFAVFGMCFFAGCLRKSVGSRITGFSFPFFVGFGAVIVLLGLGACSLAMHGVIEEELYQSVKGALAGVLFIVGGAAQVLPTAYYRIMLKKRCTEPVSATCSELLEVKLYEVNNRPVYGTAPVWQYYFEGSEYTTEDNTYQRKGELPEVGAEDEILIDPNKPERILSRYCMPRFGLKPIIAIALIIIGILFMR